MNILIASPVDPDALRALRRDHDVICAYDRAQPLSALIEDRHVLVFRSGVVISAALLDRAPGLRLLIRAGSGLDNVDVAGAAERGVHLVRVAEPAAQAVGELTLGLMIALARQIPRADAAWRRGRWVKHDLEGRTLAGKVLGIVGAGNIGARVGELGAAFGMSSIGCVEHPTPHIAEALARRSIRLSDFDAVVEQADFLTIHVPLKASTRGLIDRGVLARMKPGSFLLNLARGGVVDEEALREALVDGGRLAGAGLDVHESEGEGRVSGLADLPNVILTPHIGSTTADTQREIGRRVIQIIRSFEDAGAGAPGRMAAS